MEPEGPEPDTAARNALAASALGPLADRIEGSVQTLVDHKSLRKLSHLERWDLRRQYARLYGLQGIDEALDEAGEDWSKFEMPDPIVKLVIPDLELRDSYRQGTRKIIESMSKIFERNDGGGRGLLGRRR